MIFLIIVHFYIYECFSLEMIIQKKEVLRLLVAQYYPYAVFSYITLYTIAVICLLPFISFFTILGGFLFGTFLATAFIVIGATAGITILVSLMRYFFKNTVKYRNSFLQRFNSMLERHGIAYLLCVRLIVVIPFFIINSVVAFTNIPLFTIAWTTAIGIIPMTLLFASAGSRLEQIHQLSDLASPKIVMIFGCLILLALMPVVFEKLHIKLK